MAVILRNFNFRIICEVINSRMKVPVVFMAYTDSLLAITLKVGGIKFANIHKN